MVLAHQHPPPQSNQEKRRGMFTGSIEGLANTFAVIGTVLFAPLLSNLTAPFIVEWFHALYGVFIAKSDAAYLWLAACYFITFYTLRASLVTGAMSLAIYGATKLI